MKNFNIKAILIGLVTLIVLDGVSAVLLAAALAGGFDGEAMRALNGGTLFLILRTLVGVLSIMVGGYVLAKIAKTSIYLNAAIAGAVSLLLTVLSYDGSLPAWFNIVGFIFPFPATLLGAYFVARVSQHLNSAE